MTRELFPIRSSDIQLRRDLIAQRWTDRDIAKQVRLGTLTKVRYGAYIDSRLVAGLDDIGMYRVRSRAVLRTAHPSSVLSHHSALAEHGVPLWGVDLGETHVTRTDGKAGRRQAGVVHHCGALPEQHITSIDDVRVVTPQRAAVEVVVDNTTEVALTLVNGVLTATTATLPEIRELAAGARYWPEGLNTRIVLALADPRIESVAETRFCYLCYDQRLPTPEPQVEVYDEWGNLVGIVDFLWRKQGVFLEFDGRIKYELFRRDGETLEQYLMREKRREETICQLTGWVCIRITWADLEHPVRTSRRIRALLQSRLPVA